MILRPEAPGDRAAIFAVHTAAFARPDRGNVPEATLVDALRENGERFGFLAAWLFGILPPDPDWADHFQVRPLSAWDGSLRGTFHYASAFDGM